MSSRSTPTDPERHPRPRRVRRRVLRWSVGVLGLLLLISGVMSCTSTVVPPSSLADPAPVFLLYDARHRGLVFPDGDRHVEYAFGEWKWYVEEEDVWHDAFRALLWPTSGALGRRYTEARDEAELRARLHWMRLVRIDVERADREATLEWLDREFESRSEDAVHSRRYGFDFVPSPVDYSAGCNCNDVVVEWLERMGCEVNWRLFREDLEVAESP